MDSHFSQHSSGAPDEPRADLTPTGRPTRSAVTTTINAHLSRQRGLVSYEQLRQAGLSARSIKRRVDGGELVPRVDPARRPTSRTTDRASLLPSRGVFSRHQGPLTIDALRWRAVLAGPPGSRIGGISACVMHDLDRQRGTGLHIVYPGSGWRPSHGITGHPVDRLDPIDLADLDGPPATAVGRSLFDAAGHVDEDKLDDLLDRAVELRTYNERDLRRLIDDHPNARRVDDLEAAIARLDDKSGEFRSRFERKTTRLVETSTLIPRPVVNVLVNGFRPDLLFPGTRAILECDGRDYHRSMARMIADEEREDILLRLGFVILRLRWNHVRYEQERTLDRIERFVLANLAPPVPRW